MAEQERIAGQLLNAKSWESLAVSARSRTETAEFGVVQIDSRATQGVKLHREFDYIGS